MKVILDQTPSRKKQDRNSVGQSGLDVFAGIAHDLRSPLATITTSAELLENELDSDSSGYLISVIQRQVQRLQLMIQDIAEYAAFESGTVCLHPRTVDLTELMKQTCTDVQMLDNRHHITLEMPASPVRLNGDSAKLQRVLENLLLNAFKYSPAGTTVRTRLRFDDPLTAVLEVEDEGPGVPDNCRETIFQPFVRLEPGSNQGYGLGLNVVKSIVEAHRGRVWVESGVIGSRFCVQLPIGGFSADD